jgi:pimeloyl-ACP methyl ester carboxylesterase
MVRFAQVAVLLCCCWSGAVAGAGEFPLRAPDPKEVSVKTLGGRQFWGDVLFFHEYSIQHNVFTNHYRLLDGNDTRLASGSLEECRNKLQEIRQERKLPPMSGKAVVLIHGIIRSSKSFNKMAVRLQAEGYQVFAFDYPSTRVSLSESAAYLGRCLESLEGIEEINLVVHSMGGLVVRCYLQEHERPDPRLHRMVMMGVPNQGAGMADRVKDLGVYRFVFGPAGQQLVTDTEGKIPGLPVPEFEFAILSGARGTGKGYNPLIPGDDDGTVELERTKLPGAADFITIPVLHSFLMKDERGIDFTVRYLKTGAFRPDGKKQPIETRSTTRPVRPRDTHPTG